MPQEEKNWQGEGPKQKGLRKETGLHGEDFWIKG